MRLLLDSHVLLWFLWQNPLLGARTAAAIADPDNEVFVSAASIWEVALKRAKSLLDAPENLSGVVEQAGFVPLPLSLFHAEQAAMLPMHHRDPFDRMLIAQAQAEGLIIVTRDGYIRRYGIRTMAPDQ